MRSAFRRVLRSPLHPGRCHLFALCLSRSFRTHAISSLFILRLAHALMGTAEEVLQHSLHQGRYLLPAVATVRHQNIEQQQHPVPDR